MLLLSHSVEPSQVHLYVRSGRLLGFLVSEHGIMVDPMKVEAILRLPPLRNIRQLQGLQGKDNFYALVHSELCQFN
jgi:hypothetical protein